VSGSVSACTDPDALLGWSGIVSSRAGSIQAASQISWWSGWGSGSTGRAWKHKATCWRASPVPRWTMTRSPADIEPPRTPHQQVQPLTPSDTPAVDRDLAAWRSRTRHGHRVILVRCVDI
jgi:hypothetical protein